MNYAKIFIDKLFFMFLVPTNYSPLKFGLCLESRDEVMELKKVIDRIEFKEQVERIVENSGGAMEVEDVLSLQESKRLLKKAGVEDEKLQSDLLFRQNVSNILSEHLKRDASRKN
jgi:hypothetical protein